MNLVLMVVPAAIGLLAVPAVQAQAGCPTNTTRVDQVSQLVGGNTMCATRGSDSWQEFHSGNGNNSPLIDYKLGPNHPVDPTKQVGTWNAQIGSNSALTHTYGGTSYTWLVCDAGGGNYTLVSTGTAGTITGVTIKPGQVPCAGAAVAPARTTGKSR